MSILDYPFLEPCGRETAALVRTDASKPMLYVRLTGLYHFHGSVIALARVDTGADECVLPEGYAKALACDPNVVVPKPVNTVQGVEKEYPHTFRIEVLGVKPSGDVDHNEVLLEIQNCRVNIMKRLRTPLIGQKDFLEKYNVHVFYRDQTFSICDPGSDPYRKE